jgi:fumarate reductase subunit C
MGAPANPGAMRPARPGRTRTAPPLRPDGFPTAKRYRNYLLFDATGITYLIVGFVTLRVAWALAGGAEAWTSLLEEFANPLYLGFHALVLVSAIFVGVRFFRLFPKAQPAHIGPAKPPPAKALHALLYLAWLAITAGLVLVLGGILP